MSRLGERSDHERLAELLRTGGIAYHRERDPEWRDKPWQDGVVLDLDEDDQADFLATYLLNKLALIVAPEEVP